MAEPKSHRTNHKRKPERQERVVIESAPSAEIKELLQLVKETDSRSRVMFSKLHNLQVEAAGLSVAILQLVERLRQLLEAPTSTQREGECVVKDFIRSILDKKS